MSDLIENVKEVYKKWEARAPPVRGRLKATYNASSRRKQYLERDTFSSNFSRYQNTRNFRRLPHSRTHKYDTLAEFKMAPSVMSLYKPRPFVGIPCAKCFPHSKASIEDETAYLLGVHNILHIPYFSLRPFNICHIRNFFNINLPSFYDTSVNILKSKRVEDAVQSSLNLSDRDINSTDIAIERVHEDSRTILNSLKSSISSFFVEITGFFLHHILKKFFNGLFIHKGQMEILKTLHDEGIPFVYLPLYHSYFDYILISYILHMYSLKVPYIIVPDKFHISVLGYVFRFLGAIFVRKNQSVDISRIDILYDAILESYIAKCLQDGYSIELFLASEHSISDNPEKPSIKLLSAIVDAVSEGSIEDVYVVPVSLTYEITEGSSIAELLGKRSKQESSIFSKLSTVWNLMHFRCGNVRANFNQPFSIKEFLQTSTKQNELNNSSEGASSSIAISRGIKDKCNDEKTAADDLSIHVIYDTTTYTSLMSTQLLAFLFLTQYRKGGTQQQLQNSMDWLRDEIQRKKCDVGFSGQSLPVIKRAIELLGKDLISVETIEMEWTSSDLENNNVKIRIYTPTVKLPHVLELQYYASAVVPVFLKESILVNALYSVVDVNICHFHHCDSRFYVSRDGLVQAAIKLSEFLKYEFITVLPCQDITSVFNDAIDHLIEKECLSGANVTEGYMKPKKKKYVYSFDGSSDEDLYDDIVEQQLKIDLKEESISYLELLRNILSPYIESYWLAACSLLQLIDEVKEESIFIHEMQMIAQDKLYKGLLAYEESFSAETLRNSLKMFHDHQIIEYNYEDNIKTICLSEMYNSFESVNTIIADIEDFRK